MNNRYKPWKLWEDILIKQNWENKTDEELAMELNRTTLAITSQRIKLGLKRKTNLKMSKKEIAFIKNNYKILPVEEIAKKLGKCTRYIYYKIKSFELKLSKEEIEERHKFMQKRIQKNRIAKRKLIWTEAKDKFIKENYRILENKEIVKKLNINIKDILKRAIELNLRKKATTKEREFIKQNYNKFSIKELAKKLGLRENYTKTLLSKFGLIKKIEEQKLLKINNFIKNNYKYLTKKELAKKLNHNINFISNIIQQLKLKLTKEEVSNKFKRLYKEGKIIVSEEKKKKIGQKNKANKKRARKQSETLKRLYREGVIKPSHTCFKAGEEHHSFNGWSSREPYDKNFGEKFKIAIRERDNNICLKCNAHQEKLPRALDVHHINYDKKLTIPQNCCALCGRCNIEVNDNRKHWTKFFQSLLSERYGYQYSEQEIILEVKK